MQTLLDVNKENSPEVNTEKTKHMLMSHNQNVQKNHDTMTANKSSENATKFKHVGMAVTNQNYIHE